MNHRITMKLGMALGANELAKAELENLRGYTLTKEKVESIIESLRRSQEYILEVGGMLAQEEKNEC